VRFGGSIPGQQPTNLTGYPDCPVLDDQTSLLTIGFGPKDIVLVSSKSQLEVDKEELPGAPPLLRTGSGSQLQRMRTGHVQCPICYCFTAAHLIATHAERCELCALPSPPRQRATEEACAAEDAEMDEPGGPEEPRNALSRTYTSYMKQKIKEGKISQVVKITKNRNLWVNKRKCKRK
jgi:hypothetical protein